MHKGKMTIRRPSYGDGKKKISITVKDVDAVTRFLSVEVDYDKFTEMLTGASETECEFDVEELSRVGKKRETQKIEFKMVKEHSGLSRKEIARQLVDVICPDGWAASNSFGSQDSFFRKDGEEYARTTITRWVDKE